ncbi:MAG: alpha/beta fold hydrolase [Notoacmeibacter sp.]|nr:alpha/beta fold hydrolase [Notoacmeibacter sp.]
MDAKAEDCRWEIDGLSLAGLAWGPSEGTPVLALHGWLDHAASFDVLAPRLTGCRVVALDLSGHGLSAHRAAHATYNIWDDLPQIAALIERLGWTDAVLLGHSRGAIISSLFAAAQPDKTRAVVALDALAAEPVATDAFVATLSAFVDQTRRQKDLPPKLFKSLEDYVARRMAQGNSRMASEALAERALEETPEGLRLRGDARLFASSAVKLTAAHVEAMFGAIGCPVLNIWAEGGIRARRQKAGELARLGQRLIARYETIDFPGDHHFHMDHAVAAPMADAILAFLDRHGLR